jgi:hypothetical protein
MHSTTHLEQNIVIGRNKLARFTCITEAHTSAHVDPCASLVKLLLADPGPCENRTAKNEQALRAAWPSLSKIGFLTGKYISVWEDVLKRNAWKETTPPPFKKNPLLKKLFYWRILN